MPKLGILHDYDLMANNEESAVNQTCIICGASPITFQWSDYSGEAMCTQCGYPYQLKSGTDLQQKEGAYPYVNLKEEFIPVAQEYWQEKKAFVCYGTMLGPQPGMSNLVAWLKKTHPEFIKTKDGE